jgi:CRP-like cAMP-binding protein
MDYSKLVTSPVFRGINEEKIESLLKKVHYRIRHYSPGSVVAISGDPVDCLNIVLSGAVKGEMVDFDGRVVKIEEIYAPGAIAAGFLFGEKNRFPVTVIAITGTDMLSIGKQDFIRLLRMEDTVLVNFLDMISNRSQFLSEKIRFLAFRTLRAKLANYILQEAGKTTASIVLDKTQSDLAEMFGVARPSIARTLSEMEKDGYIEADRKNIRIVDREGLVALRAGY